MNTPKTKTRGAVIVTRVSTGEQDKHGTSPETQREACRAKAAALGVPIVAEYYDAGISGAFLASRGGMQGALADIREGRADTLICPNMSRYSRDAEHQQRIRKEVRAAGGRVVFCDMDFDDTPEGDLAFGIFGNFAEYERQVIRARTMKGRQRRAEEGLQPARRTPAYGYNVVTRAAVLRGDYAADLLGRYIVIEERAVVVRELFARYAARAVSLLELCRDLNARRIPPPGKGRCWHPSTLSGILRNPTYKGQAAYGKYTHRRDEGRLERIDPRTGRLLTTAAFRRPTDPEEWTIIPCPAIVGEDVWARAQEVSGNRQRLGGNPQRVRMLSGRVFCGECGGRMSLSSTPRRKYQREGVYYCAMNHLRSRAVSDQGQYRPCSPAGHPRPSVERAVIQALQDAAKRPESIREALRAYRQGQARPTAPADARREIAAIDRALDELGEQEARTVQAQIAGIAAGASPDAYAEVFAALAGRRKDLQGRRLALRGMADSSNGGKKGGAAPDAAELLAQIERVLTSPDVPDERKRAIIGTAIERVRCRGDKAPQPKAVEVVFLPGLFGEDALPDGVLIVQTMRTVRKLVT